MRKALNKWDLIVSCIYSPEEIAKTILALIPLAQMA